MNDEPSTRKLPGKEALEARLVAWVLGEATPSEAATLERLCQEDSELHAFHQRVVGLHESLRLAQTAASDPSWQLSAGRRQALQSLFGEESAATVPAAGEVPRRRKIAKQSLFALAACLVCTLVLLRLFRPPAAPPEDLHSPLALWDARNDEPPADLEELIGEIERKQEVIRERQQLLNRVSGLVSRPKKSAEIHSQIAILSQQKTQLETQLENLRKYNEEQLIIYAVGLGTHRGLLENFERYRNELSQSNDRSGQNLPGQQKTRESQTERAQKLKAQMTQQVEEVRDQLQTELDQTKNQIGQLSPLVQLTPLEQERARRESISRGIDRQDLVDAQEELDKQKQALAQLQHQLAEKASISPDSLAALNGPGTTSAPGSTTEASESLLKKEQSPARTRSSQDPPADAFGDFSSTLTGPVPRKGNAATPVASPPVRSDPFSYGSGAAEDHPPEEIRRSLYLAEGSSQLGKWEDARTAYRDVLRIDSSNLAARRGLERIDSLQNASSHAAYDAARAPLLSQADSSWELSVPVPRADGPPSARVPDLLELGTDIGGSELSRHEEEPLQAKPAERAGKDLPDFSREISAAEEPFSTFSLRVSDASFRLAKAALERGEQPDPAGILPEQFYNAFDYGDPSPAAQEPISGTVEQSADPLLSGRNLVRIALKTAERGRNESQSLHLTLLIDQSGSMAREDRREALASSLRQLSELLQEHDRITVIGFSRTPRLLAEGLTGVQAKSLERLVDSSDSGEGTNLEAALQLVSSLAERQFLPTARNRIALLTDGAANLGDADPDRLAAIIGTLRQKGIAFDVAGIGMQNLHHRLLEELARHGDGRFLMVADGEDRSFAQSLAGAFRPAAENVKVQVHFNPRRVSSYRLVGFEQDRLQTEEFRDDTVDAAELAAAEAGVALYQVATLAEGTGEIGEIRVRFRDAASGDMVERSWTIPYEEAAPVFERASPSLQLAGLAMLAAETLRGGPGASSIRLQEFGQPCATVQRFFPDQPAVSDLLWILRRLQ